MKSSRTTDRRGEVVGLSVERAAAIQSRSPFFQPTLKFTSWRFGNSEKSKDRSEASRPSTLRGSVDVGVLRARPEGVGPTVDGDRVRQLFEGLATRFREHYGREEAYARTTSLDLGKMQPSWDLQQHIHNILVSESIE